MATLPSRPSLEQLRKQAKELARAKGIKLADAQFAIAREYGFRKWERLVENVRAMRLGGTLRTPLIRPVELRPGRPYSLGDGTMVTTEEVYAMFVAARAGDIKAIRRLIARAPDLAVVEYNYTPPIHFAVREGHLAIVELLVERGADVAAYRSYPFGDSLLTIAEDREHEEVAALLRRYLARRFRLARGARALIEAVDAGELEKVHAELARDPTSATAANDTGDTALHHAAAQRNMSMVQTLLDAGADPDAVRGDGYRPIHLAVRPTLPTGGPTSESRAIADLLLTRGARHSMYLAAMLGDHDHIGRALARDRSLANEEDTNHLRPISAAARRRDLALVRLLLEHDARPSLPEEGAPRGHALWIAAYAGDEEMARLLLAHGADPNGMVESSGRPIDMARDKPALLELLRAHGGIEHRSPRDVLGRAVAEHRFADAERILAAGPSIVDLNDPEWGDGILAGPANQGDHDVLAFLIRQGARVPPVSKWAPYYYFKHERTAAFLLDHGMDPNHMNWHRLTLLHHMASVGELGKARLLVEHGADIDAIDEEYRSTPVALAARSGHREIVEWLLERGADPTAAGAPWATPLAWAQKRGHQHIVDLLRTESERTP